MSVMERMLNRVMQTQQQSQTTVAVDLSLLRPDPLQPRRRMSQDSLLHLADSIREYGVLQPLLVRSAGDGGFLIIAGERRWRAASLAGRTTVPVIVMEVSPEEARMLALIENLKREDLNPYEEAIGILDLLALRLLTDREVVVQALYALKNQTISRHNVVPNFEQVVDEVFRSVARMSWYAFVQHRLPLLRLPADVLQALEAGRIPYTAALELKKINDPAIRAELLAEVEAGLSLRELRRKIKGLQPPTQELPRRLRLLAPRIAQLPKEAEQRARKLLEELERLCKQKGI